MPLLKSWPEQSYCPEGISKSKMKKSQIKIVGWIKEHGNILCIERDYFEGGYAIRGPDKLVGVAFGASDTYN